MVQLWSTVAASEVPAWMDLSGTELSTLTELIHLVAKMNVALAHYNADSTVQTFVALATALNKLNQCKGQAILREALKDRPTLRAFCRGCGRRYVIASVSRLCYHCVISSHVAQVSKLHLDSWSF